MDIREYLINALKNNREDYIRSLDEFNKANRNDVKKNNNLTPFQLLMRRITSNPTGRSGSLTGGAARLNNYGGYDYMYDPRDSNIIMNDPSIMNQINPQSGRPYGRDLEELQNPTKENLLNQEYLRRIKRDNQIYRDPYGDIF